jgi:hypothetical protein
MPAFDDDDLQNYENARFRPRGRHDDDTASWDVDDDTVDDQVVPDEFTTVRCTRCRKFIFEDSIRCPYCKHMQLEEEQHRRPLWFVATVIVCVGIMGGCSLLYLLGMWPWAWW